MTDWWDDFDDHSTTSNVVTTTTGAFVEHAKPIITSRLIIVVLVIQIFQMLAQVVTISEIRNLSPVETESTQTPETRINK